MAAGRLVQAARKTFVADKVNRVHLPEFIRELESITPSNFGVSPNRKHDTDPECMSILRSPEFDISVFFIPKGKSLPLHDHPGMTVYGKLLYGSAQFVSYDLEKDSSVTLKNESWKIAKLVDSKTIHQNEIMKVEPNQGNIHSFKAAENCALLDIIAPPYEEGTRDVTYYEVIKSNNLTDPNEVILNPTYPWDYYCSDVQYKGEAIE